jgi:hypothetical protein
MLFQNGLEKPFITLNFANPSGIGIGTTIMIGYCNIYYIIILAWALHFFFSSFAWELPWATCGNSWNTENCISIIDVSQKYNITNVTKDSVVEYWE